MGKQLFIANTALIADNVDLTSANFTAGSMAISLNSAPTTATQASEILYATDKFQIWQRSLNADTNYFVSPLLSIGELVSYKKIGYDGGTAQITYVTPTLPTTQIVGDTYRLTIVDTTPGTAALTKYHYEVRHTGTDYTVDTLVDAFVALVNADANINVTASPDGGTATYLILTGDTKFNHFRVAYEGEASATITYQTDLVPATGTYAQIYNLETEFKSHAKGITNRVLYPVKDYTYEANSSYNYDLSIFHFKLQKPAKHGMSSVDFEDYYLYIAERTGLTYPMFTLLDTVIKRVND